MFCHLVHFVCLFGCLIVGISASVRMSVWVVYGSKVLCVAEICVGDGIGFTSCAKKGTLVLASGIDLAFNGFFFTFHFFHLESRASESRSAKPPTPASFAFLRLLGTGYSREP